MENEFERDGQRQVFIHNVIRVTNVRSYEVFIDAVSRSVRNISEWSFLHKEKRRNEIFVRCANSHIKKAIMKRSYWIKQHYGIIIDDHLTPIRQHIRKKLYTDVPKVTNVWVQEERIIFRHGGVKKEIGKIMSYRDLIKWLPDIELPSNEKIIYCQ